MDDATIRISLLRILDEAAPFGCTETLLVTRLVALGVRPRPLPTEVADHLRALADRRLAAAERDTLDAATLRWRITERGRAELRARDED